MTQISSYWCPNVGQNFPTPTSKIWHVGNFDTICHIPMDRRTGWNAGNIPGKAKTHVAGYGKGPTCSSEGTKPHWVGPYHAHRVRNNARGGTCRCSVEKVLFDDTAIRTFFYPVWPNAIVVSKLTRFVTTLVATRNNRKPFFFPKNGALLFHGWWPLTICSHRVSE